MTRIHELVSVITERRREVIGVVLLVTLLLGSGIHAVTLSTSLNEFRGGTVAAEKDDYVDRNFGTGAPNSIRTMLVFRSGRNIANKEHYLDQLRLQQEMMANETIGETLVEDEPPVSMANVVAITAMRRDEGVAYENITLTPMPPLEAQIERMEEMDRGFVLTYTVRGLDTVLADPGHGGPEGGSFTMVPPREVSEADGGVIQTTTMVVTQRDDTPSEQRTESQVAMAELARDRFEEQGGPEVLVFGTGVINAELEQSTRDSLLLVGPIAVLFVVVVLFFAYRDWWDIALGVLGLGIVQLWTFGFMGWAGITFNQLFAAAPVLLVGLAIDYAIHVFMRYREERTGTPGTDTGEDTPFIFPGEGTGDDPGVQAGMATGLGGLFAALGLVTLTAAIGFSSNVTSPVPPIRDFGLVTAVGIVASLAVFGVLIPAVKVELDEWLEDRGENRQLSPFGAEGQGERFTELLDRSVVAAQETPWMIVGLAALLAAGGVVGGLQVDTSFEQDELLVQEVPDWAASLPEPFGIDESDYRLAETLSFIKSQNIAYDGSVAHVLVQGDVTESDTLKRVERAEGIAEESPVTLVPDGEPAVTTPLSVMRTAARNDPSFNDTYRSADTDGDGVPDRNLEQVYDRLYETRPQAAQSVIHREDGEYRALRLSVLAKGQARNADVDAALGPAVEELDGDGRQAFATGEPILLAVVSSQLLQTIVRSMLITLFTVLVLLVVVYWRYRDAPTLGVITMLPVVLALTLIVGTMHLLDIPFNIMTALITSFTIGMGVDYAIHVSERYVYELERRPTMADALRASVLGTGGALLGSALTTAGGFAVLVFSILNPLKQFGIVTALTIIFAFVASVLVLPGLLVVWTRYLRPLERAGEIPAPADD